MSNVSAQCLIFILYQRNTAEVKNIPLANRRLATYRRCAIDAYDNMLSCEKKFARAKTKHTLTRWTLAAEFWCAVHAYFSHSIVSKCGERF